MEKIEKRNGRPVSDPRKTFILYLHDIVYLLAVIVVAFLLLFRIVVVSGGSMYDTLKDGDFLLLLSNTFYRNPQYGDIVVASKESFDHGAPIVKRVIAVGGQTVDIDFNRGIVYIDGKALEEPYAYTPTNMRKDMVFPLTVDDGCLFVMGDNRNFSKDSRDTEIGLLDQREILGRAIFLLFPGNHRGSEPIDIQRIGVIS